MRDRLTDWAGELFVVAMVALLALALWETGRVLEARLYGARGKVQVAEGGGR